MDKEILEDLKIKRDQLIDSIGNNKAYNYGDVLQILIYLINHLFEGSKNEPGFENEEKNEKGNENMNIEDNESKVNLIDTIFDEEAQWEKVLENRKNNPELRFLKNEGRTATEEDLNDILKKLNGGKAMTNEDIDNVLKKYYKEEVDEL